MGSGDLRCSAIAVAKKLWIDAESDRRDTKCPIAGYANSAAITMNMIQKRDFAATARFRKKSA
ncbi:hypothetical protein N184_22305 [Sinorhizobium sp. GL28]|nr:hypothetical protein N184_22305 [Sinorhizobium sp. GL28]